MISSSPRDQRKVRHCAADQLRADAVPFPFDLPLGRVAEVRDIAFQRIGEAERVGPADIGVAGVGGDQLAPEFGGGLPLSHQAMRHDLGAMPLASARARTTRLCETPTRNSPVISLFQTKRWRFVQLAPGLDEPAAARLVVGLAQGQQALFDPVVQRQRAGGGGRRQEQRDGFGEVADGVVALVEQPVRDAGLFDGPLRELARFQEALGTAADQEVDGPGGVLGLGGGEVALEGLDLVVGLGGLVERGVEFGEGLHSGRASGSGDSESVGNVNSTGTACLPCSCNQRTSGAM